MGELRVNFLADCFVMKINHAVFRVLPFDLSDETDSAFCQDGVRAIFAGEILLMGCLGGGAGREAEVRSSESQLLLTELLCILFSLGK